MLKKAPMLKALGITVKRKIVIQVRDHNRNL